MDFLIEIGIILVVIGILYLLNKFFNYKETFLSFVGTDTSYRMIVIFVYFLFRVLGHTMDIPVISTSLFKSATLGATLYLLQLPKKDDSTV